MDPTLSFLESTREFDTVGLARSTQRALEIIIPWCKTSESESLVPLSVSKEIQKQAHVYTRAIDYSVEAAYQGFTVAEDALSLVQFIQETTPDERTEFLKGMQEFAQRGHLKADEAHKRFMGVRTTIENILKKLREDKGGVDIDQGNIDEKDSSDQLEVQLTRGIHDLEVFSDVLSKFVAWWNEMKMETTTQLTRGNMVSQKFDKIRMRSIEAKWKDHRSRYAAYVDEIGKVQDRYHAVFTEARIEALVKLDPLAPPPPYIDTNPPTARLAGSSKDSEVVDSPRDSNVIIDEELSITSYMSASLATVQILEKKKCLLIINFQCHPSNTRRFTSLRIKWRLDPVKGSRPPKVVDVAPKHSIGARNNEHHKRIFGIALPAQFNVAGVTFGPEINQEWGMEKIVARAMMITGSARGRGPDAAEWTVAENPSAMSGIPTHFCVALVVEYQGPFQIDLDVVAKQLGTVRWWSSRNHTRGQCLVDVDSVHHKFQEYKPSRDWRTWFPRINGEIDGGVADYAQEALRRG